MAGIDTNSSHVGMKKGSTWGTEVAITSTGAMRLRPSSLQMEETQAVFNGRDIGAGRKQTAITREEVSAPVTMTNDATFGQPWQAVLASVMGTEGNPAETTVGEGDYSHTYDLADNVYGSNKIIWSLGYTIEDSAELRVARSVKFGGFSFTSEINKVGVWTFNGLADHVVSDGATTSFANLSGLAQAANYKFAPLSNNFYFRLNEESDAALDSGDNKGIESITINVNRTLTPEYESRGTDSLYIVEPREQGLIVGTMTVRFREFNATLQDLYTWSAGFTRLKAEMYHDGEQIGAGVNTSFKFQFPSMEIQSIAGSEIANNNSLMKPTVTFTLFKADAAPAGMTGVTDYLRITSIDRRSTKWTA